MGIKGGGVGAKIDHKQVLDGINHESNIVNVIGNFGREGVLHEFGFKSVVGSKGYIKREEFVQGDSSSFVDKYDCRDRPKSFPLEIARYLRKSFYFLNKFLDLTFLYDLQHLYKDINLRVVT